MKKIQSEMEDPQGRESVVYKEKPSKYSKILRAMIAFLFQLASERINSFFHSIPP